MKTNKSGIRDKILLTISHLVEKHTKKVILFFTLVTLISIYYTAQNLKFKTGRSDLISQELKYNVDWKKYRAEFGDYDGLIVAAKGHNPDRLKEYIDFLGTKLEADSEHFMDVFYKIDTGYFQDKSLLFLNDNDLAALFDKLETNQELIVNLNEEQGLENLFRQLNFKISTAMVGHLISGLLDENEEEKAEPVDLSLINSILRQMNLWLGGEEVFTSPWTSFLTKKGTSSSSKSGYLATPNESIFMITINPVENSKSFTASRKPVERLREIIATLKKDFPNIETGVTGVAALETDEMVATLRDTTNASTYALLGVAFIFCFAFRGVLKPLLAMVALVAALCWTLAWTAFFIGHLNVISVVFITILIGLGIDFGIHLILRYEEEKKSGSSIEDALDRAIIGTGKGILVGGITTALAFYAMAFADFTGIVELGLIAGSGILLSLLSMLVFLPALLLVMERNNFWEKRFNFRLPPGHNTPFPSPADDTPGSCPGPCGGLDLGAITSLLRSFGLIPRRLRRFLALPLIPRCLQRGFLLRRVP